MNMQWIESGEWERMQARIPIACVDVLPVRISRDRHRRLLAVGLIKRETPHQGLRWCLIGGRMFHEESLGEAITRHIRATLGTDVSFSVSPDEQPLYVAQYMPHRTLDFPVDPRQHAIGLTYCLEIAGESLPKGEAVAFEWFPLAEMPQPDQFGFNQDRVVAACIGRLTSTK